MLSAWNRFQKVLFCHANRTAGLAAGLTMLSVLPAALGQSGTPGANQGAPAAKAPTPPTGPAGNAPVSATSIGSQRPEIASEAKFTLDRELEAVRGMQSLRGSSLSKWEMHQEGSQPINMEHTLEFVLAKPTKLMLKTRDLVVFADGNNLVVYSTSLKQYVQRPQPDPWLLRDQIEQMSGGQIRTIPSEALIRPGMSLDQTLRNVRTVERVRAGDYEAKTGLWVSGTAIDDRQPGSRPFSFERWYSDEDNLLYVVRQDWTQMYQDQVNRMHAEQHEGEANAAEPKKINFARWTTTFTRVPNAPVSDSEFVFKPGSEDKRVSKFYFPHPRLKDQAALLGRQTPALVGNALDGKPFDFASLTGKVIVLDFWATWCGPCVASMPAMQALMTSYTDQPVAFVAINRDDEAKASFVPGFLLRRGISIPQVLDGARGPLGQAYYADSIPCVVLIDQRGIVQDIDTGYIPGKELELKAKIDKLLAGQPVRTEQELSEFKQQVGAP